VFNKSIALYSGFFSVMWIFFIESHAISNADNFDQKVCPIRMRMDLAKKKTTKCPKRPFWIEPHDQALTA